MSLPVTVYRWDDAGAPQITAGTPSEIIDVLRKCLVDGYGTKAGAGWSVAFEDAAAFKIAFQNSTVDGSGGYVQFWSNNGTNNSSDSVVYKAAQGMPALDSFIRAGYSEVIKGNLNYAYYNHWMIIATSTACYLFMMRSSITTMYKGYYSVFIGDFDSFIQNDAAKFIGSSGQGADRTSDTSITFASQALFYSSLQCKPILYGTDADDTAITGSVSIFNAVITDSLVPEANDIDANITLNFVDVLIKASASQDNTGVVGMISTRQPYIRGKMPGLLESTYAGYTSQSFPYIREFFGQQYMLCPTFDSKTGLRYWLNIEEWY